jgi:dipeptidyl aminopeptidase/acylaminoacyl peptidase
MTVAPYGTWHSPIDVEAVVAAGVSIAEPWIDGDDVYWLEQRPLEGGRRALLRRGIDGVVHELTPMPLNVRTRVHEYGGGSYTAVGGIVVASSFPDGRLLRIDREGIAAPVPLTPDGPWRYADLRLDLARRRVLAVREEHRDGARCSNTIVDLPLDGEPSAGRVLVSGPDFVAAPRLSPDGTRLAWLEWDDPDMPWDATRLRVADVAVDGGIANARTVAGGPGESIVQPEWAPDGDLVFASDRSGWWNLYGGGGGAARLSLAPMAAECADPAWVFGRSGFGFGPDGVMLLAARSEGRDRLHRRDPGGSVHVIETGWTELEGLRVAGELALVVASGPRDPAALVRLDARSGEPAGVLATSSRLAVDARYLPEPEAIAFPTSGGATARALFYRPSNPSFAAPDGALPPLLVHSHGGPTSNASSALSFETAFWTSRGVAVVDVDYRGSTGYGRAYREALGGSWGIVDVDDCVAAARYLADRGDVDGARMAITGGSAGGFTTLACLVFRPGVFAAGISEYGVADLEALAADTHKFEARYLDRLVAPWPEGRDVYRARSPIHHLDRMAAPMLVLQGMEDRVVPPNQAEAMVAALAARGIPHAVRYFDGEGHGFRRAETKRAALEAKLSFLGQVLGFVPADDLPALRIEGIAPPAAGAD